MNIDLTVEEVNAVFTILGQLPTSTGAYPLMMKIKQQAEYQLQIGVVKNEPDSPSSQE